MTSTTAHRAGHTARQASYSAARALDSDWLQTIGRLGRVAKAAIYAVFGLPIGWLVDRFSRRRIIYFGMTLWSLSAGACGLAASYWQLLIARFGVGVGEASLSPAAYSMIADLFPPRRLALAVGVFATGSSIGAAMP